MPKLFVHKDYVDDEVAKLRHELNELKSHVHKTLQWHCATTVDIGEEQNTDKTQTGTESETSVKTGFSLAVDADEKTRTTWTSNASLADEDITFQKRSAWSIPLVLNWSNLSESIFASLLLILNVTTQLLLTIVLVSPGFIGEDFFKKLESARNWRRSFAHDIKYASMSDRSLATMVCDEDGSLIFSTAQAGLVAEINSYLGLSKSGDGAFQLPYFQPGVMLSVLCILLWAICIGRELRNVWSVARALRYTGHLGGTWQDLPWQRALSMAVVCLSRTAVAVALLISGSMWLARTTSITELMLNCVALEAVLHVDEFIFTALVPTNLQQLIRTLPPVKIPKGRRWPLVENCILFLGLTAALVLPYSLLHAPLSKTMVAVKMELCAGNLEFVMGVKDDLVRVVPTRTSVSDLPEMTYIETAVLEYAFPSKVKKPVAVPIEELDVTRTYELLSQGYGVWKRERDICRQHNENGTNFSAYLASAAFAVGMPGATSCEELKFYCSDSAPAKWIFSNAALWLRLACPRTCGCTTPLASPVVRTPRWGCQSACIQESFGFGLSRDSPFVGQVPNFTLGCKDVSPGTPGFEGLQHFWDHFVTLSSIHNAYDYSQQQSVVEFAAWAREVGCPAIAYQPVDLMGNLACRGSSKYLPLAWFCPQTCGCATSRNTERDYFCFAYDYCPMHVLPDEEPAAWQLILKHDLLETLMNPDLLSYQTED
ncbi:unnamed protein product [Effrenium voratum]|uniref:Uncharacterized protein n=1 Tax=Effrenium voratum TaxID=2562239 RepID=A0AA36IYX7_9DINO|nr:unnamed protein product [Effrenium voratum]CAJ1429663.1 unnamed protein product [Effrenium voratum]